MSIHDEFSEAGGHSLLATRLLNRVHDAFGVTVPLRVFFQAPTIAELAVALAQLQAAQVEDGDIVRLLAEMDRPDAEASPAQGES